MISRRRRGGAAGGMGHPAGGMHPTGGGVRHGLVPDAATGRSRVRNLTLAGVQTGVTPTV